MKKWRIEAMGEWIKWNALTFCNAFNFDYDKNGASKPIKALFVSIWIDNNE